jgi:hypothetical protein
LRWATKPPRTPAAEPSRQGYQVGADTVAGLLSQKGFRLQPNTKRLEGGQHADRNVQFRSLGKPARDHLDAGQPVISVDAKKELVGDFRDLGRSRRPTGGPVLVRVHDFADPQPGRAIPHGICAWRSTPVGSTAAPTVTESRSRRSRSADGGTARAGPPVRGLPGC